MRSSLFVGSLRRFDGIQSRNLHVSSIITNAYIIRPSSHYQFLFSTATFNRSATNWATKSTFEPELTEDSWAAPRLEEVGEKLLPSEFVAADEYVEVTEEILKSTTPRVDYLVSEILSLNPFERMEMQNLIQKRLGYSDEVFANFLGGGGQAADGGSAGGGAAADTAVKEEKTTFDIKIGLVDAKVKIKVIKEVRSITGLGLKEAKEMVEKAPIVLKQGVKKEEAENFKKLLTDAGAEVTLE